MDAAVPFFDLGGMTQEVRSDVDAAWSTLLGTGHFVGGAEVDRFEEEWARYCGTAHAIGVANGTDALTLTLRALAIGAGDEVVVPANTFIATAEAVVLAGATPRFADVDPDTLLLTADGLAAAITSRTSAVIAVHLYGQTADMDAISVTAERAALAVLEDAAQAHGASWWGRPAGSLGRAGCFSFYPGKNLGAFGDAGAVVTDDADLTERLRSLRNHGRVSGSHYRHGDIGTNSRLDSVQAAVLSAKLPRLDAWVEARRAIVGQYREALGDGPMHLVATAPGAEHACHLAVVEVPDRDAVRAGLGRLGIETAVHYPVPCHRHGPYRRFATGPLPVAEGAAERVLSLPLFPHMSVEQITRVCEAVQQLVHRFVVSDGV
jgi:dTDP-4-amino-4,6-dideoxygalactose transaminase